MDALERACLSLFATRPGTQRALPGGDLSDIREVTLQGGGSVVVKSGPLAEAEAKMLTALAAAKTPVPKVLGTAPNLLFLEKLTETRARPESWARLGTALKRQHQTIGPRYGWDRDFAFGPVSIPNGFAADWPDFWAGNRLLTHLAHLPAGVRPRLTALCEKLPRLLPKSPPPALLHGDLWTGNILFGPENSVHLIDPASYYGDAEVDLAMLHLFGSPHSAFADAYGPLAPGWETRRAVYTLWPALVHLRLFGSSYRAMVDRLLSDLGV